MRSEGLLEGHGVLVTGGGTGIGRACAAEAARQGAKVMICGRTRSPAGGGGIARWPIGARDRAHRGRRHGRGPTSPRRWTRPWRGPATSRAWWPTPAGAGCSPRTTSRTSPSSAGCSTSTWSGPCSASSTPCPALVAAGGGSFVGMSSIAATATHRVFGAYPVAKAAIDAMMRNAADEYGPAGVRFNSVQPGFVDHRDHGGDPPRQLGVRELPGQHAARRRLGAGGRGVGRRLPARARLGAHHRARRVAVDGGHNLRAGPDFRPFTGLSPDQLLARATASRCPPGGRPARWPA